MIRKPGDRPGDLLGRTSGLPVRTLETLLLFQEGPRRAPKDSLV
ncbi:hypothetical protein HNQ76_001393 [Thermosulfuriphilus ammonigenes]|nr:hypothetical protein [Thermosulfuriphilus ammonigenes]MBA2849004.1 hypothetical protein [Thermosulfuriphilus ammonigenes]